MTKAKKKHAHRFVKVLVKGVPKFDGRRIAMTYSIHPDIRRELEASKL